MYQQPKEHDMEKTNFKDINSNSFRVNYFNRYKWENSLLERCSILSYKIRDFELRQRINGLFDGFYYKDISDYLHHEEKEEVRNEIIEVIDIISKLKTTLRPNKDDYTDEDVTSWVAKLIDNLNGCNEFVTSILIEQYHDEYLHEINNLQGVIGSEDLLDYYKRCWAELKVQLRNRN